jgi:hypothetical protein
MSRTSINVNLHLDKKNNILPIRSIAQGTNNFDIVVSVFANSSAYTIPATTTARMYIKKPDSLIVYNDCTIASNKITCGLTTQATIAAGMADVEIEMTDSADSTITRTTICKLDIVKSNIDGAAIESSNEFTALQTALNEVGDVSCKLDKIGDSKDCTVTFTEAATDEDIASGETHNTLFGKILKSIKTFRIAITDLTNDKLDKTSVINNLTTTIPGSALDAVQGQVLQDEIDTINNSLTDVGSATLLGELTTTAPGTIPGSITPYRFIVLDVGYGGGVHKKFTYPVGVMLTGELVEEKHYASTTYSMSIQFYLSGGQYIHISSLVLVGWSFDNIRLYGIK